MRLTRKPPTRGFWILLIFGVIGIFCGPRLFAEYRLWNSKVGTKVEAQFISQTNTHVVLKTKAGAQITVEKTKLSDNDQAFLQWLAPDPKKPAAKPQDSAKPKSVDTTKSEPPAESPPSKKSAPKSGDSTKPGDTGKQPPPGKKAITKPDPQKLELPLTTYPMSSDWTKQKPIADPPKTDYVKLANELCAPVPRPQFAEVQKFKLPLVNPETALIAQGGIYLVDHNDQKEQLDVWNIDTGKLINSIKVGPLANPRCFAISPAGSFVGLGRNDHAIVAYHVVTGKTMCTVSRLATEGKKLVRLAFNWEEDELVTLNDAAEIDRMLLLGPQFKRHTFRGSLPEGAGDYAANNDEIWLTVSGQGRIGARLTDRFTYTCYVQNQHAGFKAQAHRDYLAIPIRNGTLYWSRNELTRYSVSYRTKPTDAKQDTYPTAQYRAMDCIDFAKYSLDRADRYLWVSNETGTETIDIYDLDCFDIPVRVATPVLKKANQLHWHSSAARRLYYYDPKSQELTIYELQKFEPPPSWKVIDTFHRAFLEKRYDRLEGLAAALDKDMRHLVGGRQLPVLTDVIRTFTRQQFLVPPDEWQSRLVLWLRERPDSTFARLTFAHNRILGAQNATQNDPPLKNELPAHPQARAWVQEAENLLKEPLAAKQPWGETLYLQLRLAPLLGWEKDKCLELAARMAKIAPEHTDFHYQMCKLLLPEERGDDGETELYAKTIADHFPNDKGDILYSYMVYRTTLAFGLEDYKTRFKFDWLRAKSGFVANAKLYPDDAAAIMRAREWHTYNTPNPHNLSKEDKPVFGPIYAAYKKIEDTNGWNVYMRPREGRRLLED